MRSLSQLLNEQKPLKFSMEFMDYLETELDKNKYNSQRGLVEKQIISSVASKNWNNTDYNFYISSFANMFGFRLLLDSDDNVIDFTNNADYFEYRRGFVCKFERASENAKSVLAAVYNKHGDRVLDLESNIDMYRDSKLEIIHAGCGDFALLSVNNSGKVYGKIHKDFELYRIDNDEKWIKIQEFEADSYRIFETVKDSERAGDRREFKPYIEYVSMENPDDVPELRYINRTNEKRSGYSGITLTIPVKHLLNLETGMELVYVEIGYAKEALIKSNNKTVNKLIKQTRKTSVDLDVIDALEKYQYNELIGHGRNPVGVHGLKIDELTRRNVETLNLLKILHKKYILGELRV